MANKPKKNEGRSLGFIASHLLGVSRPTLNVIRKNGFGGLEGNIIAKVSKVTGISADDLLGIGKREGDRSEEIIKI
jgi:hypothetical protein